MPNDLARSFIVAAGAAQLVIVVASTAIPRVLGWRGELAQLRPLTRAVFWTYAGYILATNLALGLLSVLAPRWLLDESGLAYAVCAFAFVWWAARIVIQFALFRRADAPKGLVIAAGEIALLAAFALCVVAYGYPLFERLGR